MDRRMTALPVPSAEAMARDNDAEAFGQLGPALRRLHRDGPYLVRDAWGNHLGCFWTLRGAIECARGIRGADIINLDRCDGGGGDDGTHFHDGLTDDEREEMENEL